MIYQEKSIADIEWLGGLKARAQSKQSLIGTPFENGIPHTWTGTDMCQISIATRVVGQVGGTVGFCPVATNPCRRFAGHSRNRALLLRGAGARRALSVTRPCAASAESVAFDTCVPQQISIDTYDRSRHSGSRYAPSFNAMFGSRTDIGETSNGISHI